MTKNVNFRYWLLLFTEHTNKFVGIEENIFLKNIKLMNKL